MCIQSYRDEKKCSLFASLWDPRIWLFLFSLVRNRGSIYIENCGYQTCWVMCRYYELLQVLPINVLCYCILICSVQTLQSTGSYKLSFFFTIAFPLQLLFFITVDFLFSRWSMPFVQSYGVNKLIYNYAI